MLVTVLVSAALAGAVMVTVPEAANRAPLEQAVPPASDSVTTAATDPPAPAPPGTPAEWDPRVADLVRFIEEERELTFRHPVPVELMDEAEYRRRQGADSETLGFYDGERVVGRGTELTPALQGTLVHELTHALDDQHFDIFERRARPGLSEEEMVAYAALVEGDAMRIERAYDEMLISQGVDPAEVEDRLPGEGQTPDAGEPPAPGGPPTTVGSRPRGPLPGAADRHRRAPAVPASYGSDIPSLDEAMSRSPYYLGEQFVALIADEGGNAAVDSAFRDPPVTTEQVLDQRIYVARSGPLTVEPPAPGGAANGLVSPPTSFGALHLYLVLAASIDPVVALDAATGWGGESAVTYRDDAGRSCAAVAFVGDTPSDTAEIGSALSDWAESGLAGQASVSVRDDGAHVVDACDIGDGQVSTDPFDALVLPAFRNAQIWGAVHFGGLGADEAFAFGECVVHTVPFSTFVAIDDAGEIFAEAEEALRNAAFDC